MLHLACIGEYCPPYYASSNPEPRLLLVGAPVPPVALKLGGRIVLGGKDSAEVVKFMSLFAKLKDLTNDPNGLADLAEDDEHVLKLCLAMYEAASDLHRDEQRERQLFAMPVDPNFIQMWRDYEEKYASILAEVDFVDFFRPPFIREPSKLSHADARWDIADREAAGRASAIKRAIKFAQLNAEQWPEETDNIEEVEAGVAAWEHLEGSMGFDVRGVFRRRALIPFVLVPRSVAAKHNSSEVDHMFKNLQQAHDAFVFGATYGALALMRSIMEAVLRDHYQAEGKDLNERIRSADGRLPPSANKEALHCLRRLANAVLHLDQGKFQRLTSMNQAKLEREIIRLLIVLRALIEGVR